MKTKKGLTWWVRLGGTILAIGLTIALLGREDWGDIWQTVQDISWSVVLLALFFITVSRFAVVGRWHVLLRSAELDVSLKEITQLTFAGLFASNFLPSTIGGDVVRLAGLMQAKHDTAISTASLVVDRLVGMLGMALMLPLGAQHVLFSQTSGLGSLAMAGWGGKLWQKGQGLLKRLLNALSLWLKKPQALFISLFFTGIHMLGFFGAMWVLLNAMKDPMPFYQIASLWSLVYFITLLPISINGIGLQEVSIVTIFSTFGGISEGNAAVLALLFRLLVMVASLPGAFSLPALLPQARQQQANAHLNSEDYETK